MELPHFIFPDATFCSVPSDQDYSSLYASSGAPRQRVYLLTAHQVTGVSADAYRTNAQKLWKTSLSQPVGITLHVPSVKYIIAQIPPRPVWITRKKPAASSVETEVTLLIDSAIGLMPDRSSAIRPA